jgi:hypothetical protein
MVEKLFPQEQGGYGLPRPWEGVSHAQGQARGMHKLPSIGNHRARKTSLIDGNPFAAACPPTFVSICPKGYPLGWWYQTFRRYQPMDASKKEQIALFRFGLIFPLLDDRLKHGDITRLVKQICEREHDIPFSGKKSQHAFDCYISHFDTGTHVNDDIGKIPVEEIPDHTLLVGGFPCQDYSVAATGAKGIHGKKGVLWWEIKRIIEGKRPRFVLLENVDRLLKSPAKQRGRDFAIM